MPDYLDKPSSYNINSKMSSASVAALIAYNLGFVGFYYDKNYKFINKYGQTATIEEIEKMCIASDIWFRISPIFYTLRALNELDEAHYYANNKQPFGVLDPIYFGFYKCKLYNNSLIPTNITHSLMLQALRLVAQ